MNKCGSCARGADMDWDQAVAYTITQATQALNDLGSERQPWRSAGASAQG